MRSVEPLTLKEQVRYGSNHKITPVSHTNLGGYLKPWNDMWINFWDTTKGKIEWVGLDEFMVDADWNLPLWQIPVNKNNPYTPDRIRPVTSYDEVEKVYNPCRVENIGKEAEEINQSEPEEKEKYNIGNKIMMFHNGQGPMCLEAVEFFKTVNYPVEQYLDSEEGFSEKLDKLKTEFSSSEGIHPLFGYYPIIFIKDRVFSGFNETIKNEIIKETAE